MSTKKKFNLSAIIHNLIHQKQKEIEAQNDTWDISDEAISERKKKLNDPKNGFSFFVQNYFPHFITQKSQSELHQYLFSHLPEILQEKKGIKSAMCAPRGEAKSTIVTRLFGLYCAILNKKHYIVLIMETYSQAREMLEAIKRELLENPRLISDFPDACGEGRIWRASSIVMRNNVKIQACGSGNKLRGAVHGARRPDLVVLDDLENDEKVRSPEQRDKLEDWLHKTVTPLGAVGDKFDIVYIGTILHYDSVLSRILLNPAWLHARFKAIKHFPDDLKIWDDWELIYRERGAGEARAFYHRHREQMDAGAELSWEARPLLDLMEIRASIGHDAFATEYQNEPASGASAIFANCLNYYSHPPQNLVYFMAIDPSMGQGDPSAILVGGVDKAGVLYVIEASIKKRLPDLIISDIIALQERYDCQKVFVENIQFQEFFRTELVKQSREQGIPVPAVPVTPNKNKNLRIETLQPHLANRSILLNHNHTSLNTQLRHYPHADHDDGVDALQMLWANTVKQQTKPKIQSFSFKEPSF